MHSNWNASKLRQFARPSRGKSTFLNIDENRPRSTNSRKHQFPSSGFGYHHLRICLEISDLQNISRRNRNIGIFREIDIVDKSLSGKDIRRQNNNKGTNDFFHNLASLLSHRRDRILSLIGSYGIIRAVSPSMCRLSCRFQNRKICSEQNRNSFSRFRGDPS